MPHDHVPVERLGVAKSDKGALPTVLQKREVSFDVTALQAAPSFSFAPTPSHNLALALTQVVHQHAKQEHTRATHSLTLRRDNLGHSILRLNKPITAKDTSGP